MAEETQVHTYEPPEEFVAQANVNDPSVYKEAEKAPKTTECGAPMRAHASIAIGSSGIIGR